jgi:O-methyltransferase domain/Dimerisation domain
MAKSKAKESPQEMPPSAQLLQMIFGFMNSQAISVAAKLGVADSLANGAKSADELAKATGTQARPLYRILRALASVGVFAEDDRGRFRLTPMAEALRSDAPDSLRAFAIFLGADWHWRVWSDLFYSAQAGQPGFERIYGKPYFDYLAENPEPARVFHDAMTSFSASVSVAVVDGYDFTGIKKLIDVGGGHGLLLAAILEKYPQMKGVLFDAPEVITGAKSVLETRGVEGRCEIVGGDFFASVPSGGDAYIMKHIIHDWEDERALKILQNCHQAMTKDGKILVVEMVIPQGNAPSLGKFLDLEMLLFLHSYERTAAEYRALFKQAGFKLTKIVATRLPHSVIEAVRV